MVAALPTGLVSFLFTDVEGSTRLWEQDRHAMAASLALHDQIMQSVIADHHGHVFSTAGDAFAVAFHSIGEAVSAAVEIQRGLQNADWPGPAVKVRMGIHTGDAQERDGDYFGPVLNRAARIMSAGHGGQILLSSVTAAEIEADLHDLGTHHLKDLEEPEHLFEIRHPELAVVDRPIKTVDLRRHNLPDYLTSFVGRDEELANLAAELDANRLVVLTGVGGTGKTRLAVEAARSVADSSPDGAWLVELAPVTNPQFIMTTIGETWGLRPGEGASIEDVVTRYLWGRTLTLIIDNCEHVLDHASAAVKLLLDACPNLTILATSRESLGIAGEVNVPIPSLGLPDASHPGDSSESVQLFLQRAEAARPGWEPTDGELADVARICTRIDGIPLGLELAAARLRSLSASDLADKLDDSFRILSRSAKTALPRQRTLAATIDWSYDLLKPSERALFRRLAMFLGGFDLEAAEAVAVGGEVEDWEVLDLLDSLVDKSLVVASHDETHGTRFRLLEPVRQYAQEKLAEEGESPEIARAHAEYYSDLVGRLSPLTRGPEQMPAERRLDLEYDNIRGSFEALLEIGEIERYLTMGFDLFIYQQHIGMQIEARATLLAGLRAAPDGTDPWVMLKAWHVIAISSAEITDPAGIPLAREGLELAESMGHPNAIGRAHLFLAAVIIHSTNDPEGVEHLRKARDLLEANPDPHWFEPQWDEGGIQLLLGAYLPVDDPRKGEHIDRAIAIFEEIGDQALLGASLDLSAWSWDPDGHNDHLLANMRRAVEILDSIQVPYWLGHAMQTLGSFLNRVGELEEAASMFKRGRVYLEECGDFNCWAGSTRGLSYAETGLGRYHESAKGIASVIDFLPVLPLVEWDVPFTLDQVARVLQVAGHHERSAIALGRALEVPLPRETIFGREDLHDMVRQALIEDIGESEVERLMAEGAALSNDELFEKGRVWLLEAAEA